ncbi:O-antigen ligase family protein [Hahella sp. SMD15-11]|uniref:O-antigen ligase family protein n=1 Tax=Thermohahella caldifontis TaxID=3142973 RepID=A0AB39USR3_9GAMM
MADVVVKYGFPFVFFVAYVVFCIKQRSTNIRLAALFFTSAVSFSQNFVFVFREVHQFIQLFLVCMLILLISKRRKLSKVIGLFSVFALFVFLSIGAAPFDSDVKVQTANFILVFLILTFLFTAIHSVADLISLLKYIGFLGFLLSCSGIFEYLIGGTDRIEGTFANPNYFALFVALSWVLVLSYCNSFIKYFFIAVMTVSLFLSGSRSALVIPLIHFCWLFYRGALGYRRLAYGFMFLLGIFILFSSGLTRFSSLETSASDAERLIFAKMAINMAYDNPAFGVGWGRFVSEYSNYSISVNKVDLSSGSIDPTKYDRRVTHNDLLRILAELGFLAFFICVYFVAKTFVIIVRYHGFNVPPLFACWTGIVFFSFTHNNLNTAMTWFFIFLPWFVFYKCKASKYVSHVN